jgi:hypothetical protein
MVDLSEDKVRFQVTKDDVKTKNFPVHVLLVVPQQHLVPVPRTVSPVAEPTGIWMKIEEFRDVEEDRKELTYYQRRGRLIKDKCLGFCAKFLDKVDESYHKNERPSRSSALKGRQVWGNRS